VSDQDLSIPRHAFIGELFSRLLADVKDL